MRLNTIQEAWGNSTCEDEHNYMFLLADDSNFDTILHFIIKKKGFIFLLQHILRYKFLDPEHYSSLFSLIAIFLALFLILYKRCLF